MCPPKISVVTPSYNQASFLKKNLESVRSQSYEPVEHIVIDGGSDDGTVDILREYEDEYDLQWVSEPDRGQTHALNKGIEMATGDWIGWQNSDDYYLPGSFASAVAALDRNPSADAVYGDICIVDSAGSEPGRQFMVHPSKFVQRYWSLFASNQSLFVRTETLDRIHPLDEDLVYTMDAALTWELLTGSHNLVHIPETLGAFRVQKNAKTFSDVSEEQRRELDRIYDHPWYESVVPRSILEATAQCLKFAGLLRGRRCHALEYNIRRLCRDIVD